VSALGQVISLRVRTSAQPVFRKKKLRGAEEGAGQGAEQGVEDENKMEDDEDMEERPSVDEDGVR